jgi:hypothetical protein
MFCLVTGDTPFVRTALLLGQISYSMAIAQSGNAGAIVKVSAIRLKETYAAERLYHSFK